MRRFPVLAVALLSLFGNAGSARPAWEAGRPDSELPAGVGASYSYPAGRWSLEYRYERLSFGGLRDGEKDLVPAQVLADFPAVMTEMDAETHVLRARYALGDRWTVFSLFSFALRSMEVRTREGRKVRLDSEGAGDWHTGLSRFLYENGPHELHLEAGLGLPTGSIDEKDRWIDGARRKLPYPLQLGSGTFDLRPAVVYLGMQGPWSWGLYPAGTLRLGKNSAGYDLGDTLEVSGWAARKWTPWLSTSLRFSAEIRPNIRGRDADLDPASLPAADPDRMGGERVDLLFGFQLSRARGFLGGHRLGLEAGLPVHESLEGPQLERDWRLYLAWRKTFGEPVPQAPKRMARPQPSTTSPATKSP
ncbi:MAG: hypothetical protein KatS3mg076_1961 [Candidatus Binatia bacterium]|nr:MAG: hypothetical protein KatS3mg076_1961 [Candidatus Binatia bacterium]